MGSQPPRAPAPSSSAPDCRRASAGPRRCRRDNRPARYRAPPAACRQRRARSVPDLIASSVANGTTVRPSVKCAPMVRADTAVNPRAQNSVLPAEGLQRRGKILIRPQPQRKRAALGLHIRAGARDGTEQFEIGLGIGLGHEHRAVDAERFHRERFGDDALLGQECGRRAGVRRSRSTVRGNGRTARRRARRASSRRHFSRVMPEGRNVSL